MLSRDWLVSRGRRALPHPQRKPFAISSKQGMAHPGGSGLWTVPGAESGPSFCAQNLPLSRAPLLPFFHPTWGCTGPFSWDNPTEFQLGSSGNPQVCSYSLGPPCRGSTELALPWTQPPGEAGHCTHSTGAWTPTPTSYFSPLCL